MINLPKYITDKKRSSIFDHPFINYIGRVKTRQPLGADIVGAVLPRMQAIYDAGGFSGLSDRMFAAPGDRTISYGKDHPRGVNSRVGLGIPIDYDIWYLFPAGNMLVFGGKARTESMEKLDAMMEALDGVKPLKPSQSDPVDVPFTFEGGGTGDLVASMGFTQGDNTEYAIKEARFEIYEPSGSGAVYGSDGPKETTEDYIGYIAFPIGPMGVMANISLSTASMFRGSKASVVPVEYETAMVQGGDILPPFNASQLKAAGVTMMSKGYLVDDDQAVEILADDFGGEDNPRFHKWLRYWLRPEIDTIIPGEFVGMLCRPWPLHCWWNQETSPLLYAGTWLETEFYTSGTIKEVIEPEQGEVGNRYRVWVKNEEIVVKSSDFYGYEVDNVVGLLKTVRDGGESGGGSVGPGGSSDSPANFTWKNLELQDTGEELNTTWVIVPADFYDNGL